MGSKKAEYRDKPDTEQKNSTTDTPQQIRIKAEARLAAAGADTGPALPADVLLHELQVHQIELEMQNLELRDAQLALNDVLEHYVDLYDFSPLGYLTITDKGIISQANLTGAAMLGYTRAELMHQPLSRFVHADSCNQWYLHFNQVMKEGRLHRIELLLKRKNMPTFHAELDCLRMRSGNKMTMRIAISDITLRKQAEDAQKLLLQENRALTHQMLQVREEERGILASELHDKLGPLLTNINWDADFILSHSDNAECRAKSENILQNIKNALDLTHDVLKNLKPVLLDILGFKAALTDMTSRWEQQTGIQCSLKLSGNTDSMQHSYSLAIFRLIQEALTNTQRHSNADCVQIEINSLAHGKQPARVCIKIHDNGECLDIKTLSEGMGIIGMRERTSTMGGTFELSSPPQGGLQIAVTLPLIDSGDHEPSMTQT